MLCYAPIQLSCTSESSEFGEAIPKETNINYFPLQTGNQWAYEVEGSMLNQPTTYVEERLKVADSIFEYETPGFIFTSDLIFPERGFASQFLTEGLLNKVEGKLVFNGDFIFRFPLIEENFGINLENFLILHQNVAENHLLQKVTGEKSYVWDLQNKEIPLKFDYQLTMKAGKTFKNHATVYSTFEEVITSVLELELSATVLDENSAPIEIMEPQKVLAVEFYFAKETGIIYCKADKQVIFKNLQEIDLEPIPEINGYQTQTLTQLSLK